MALPLPLVLKGLNYAAANIPDKVFEAVPGGYFKEKDPKDQKRKSRRKSHKRRSSPSPSPKNEEDSDRDSRSGEYEQSKGRTPEVYEHSRGEPPQVEQTYVPYDQVEEKHAPYEQYYPQRNHAKPEKMAYQNVPRDGYAQPRPYNPQDYETSSSFRPGYHNEAQYGANRAAYAPPYGLYRRPSSAGPDNRYRRESRQESPHDNNGYYNNDNGHSDRGRHYERHHERKHRPKSHKGSRSRSSSRGIADRFDTSGRGVGSATIGAIAGGLIGNEVGHGILPAVAGAVLGGLGANVWERNHHKNKEEREREREEGRGGRYASPDRYTKGYASDGDHERNERAERRRRRRRERQERDSRG